MGTNMSPGEFYKWLFDQGMSEEQLLELAMDIYRIYVAHRRGLYPAYDPPATPDDIQPWVLAAQQVTEEQADPSGWVVAQFDRHSSYCPAPNNLHGVCAAKNYAEWSQGHDERPMVEEMFRLVCAKYQRVRERRPDLSAAAVLSDVQNGFDPLFVWCMAKALGLHELAARHERAALAYLRRPVYKEVYATVFKEVIDG